MTNEERMNLYIERLDESTGFKDPVFETKTYSTSGLERADMKMINKKVLTIEFTNNPSKDGYGVISLERSTEMSLAHFKQLVAATPFTCKVTVVDHCLYLAHKLIEAGNCIPNLDLSIKKRNIILGR